MLAKSKAQQRFFGMVDAYKKGEMPDASQSIKDAAESMSSKEVKKFAKTKHKGLPNHVKKHKKKVNESIMMLSETDVRYIVSECVNRIIKENSNNIADYIQDLENSGILLSMYNGYRILNGLPEIDHITAREAFADGRFRQYLIDNSDNKRYID